MTSYEYDCLNFMPHSLYSSNQSACEDDSISTRNVFRESRLLLIIYRLKNDFSTVPILSTLLGPPHTVLVDFPLILAWLC